MTLTVRTALDLIQAAVRAGNEKNVPVAAAIVDTGGRVVAAVRSEQAGFINLDVAQRKATAAANFKAPTHGILEMLRADPVALAAVMSEPTLCLLPGGFPIVIDGALAGGLGIAGGHYTQDQAIGEQALAAL
jgi:glc operon protein GlcG